MIYTVQPGDTLSTIAQRHDMSVERILQLNPHIGNPNRIVAGQTLALPGAPVLGDPPPATGQARAWLDSLRVPKPPRLGEFQFESAARDLGCEVAAVKAVTEVEAPGSGFLDDGRPKILFEAHVFSRLTGKQYDLTHTDISSPKWNKALYIGGAGEYRRLERAMGLDSNAALQSASWGRFQAMGFNHVACGFDAVEPFVAELHQAEGRHLWAFVNFVRAMRLDKWLKEKNWAKFAEGYNGAGYRANQYDTKLAAAYRRLSA